MPRRVVGYAIGRSIDARLAAARARLAPTSGRVHLPHRPRIPADLVRQRYRQVDPGNRLVADVLEAEWNACLRALEDAQRESERKRAEDRRQLDEGQRQRILALATDFPRLWNDPATPDRERKRMARPAVYP